MAPSRRKATNKAAAAAAARRQWKVGDLVLAKVKGFPAWPATVSEPEKWGYSSDWKKVLVYFFGTQQIAFCNPSDVEAFTEEKKQSLMGKRQGKGADFLRAVKEIVESYEKLKNQIQVDVSNCVDTVSLATDGNAAESPQSKELTDASEAMLDLGSKTSSNVDLTDGNRQNNGTHAVEKIDNFHDNDSESQPAVDVIVKGAPVLNTYTSRKRSGGTRSQKALVHKESSLIRRARNPSRQEPSHSLAPSLLCRDGGRSAKDIPGSISRNGSLRRSKRVRKSPDATESDEVDVSLFVSNGSVEDDGSEVATVENDAVSLNECSPIDSGPKSDHSEAPECLDGDADMIKGLDFQIKAVVVKKKRKPNRKRMANDSTEAPFKIVTEAGMEMEVQNNWEKLQDACMNLDDKYRKEDGDKHLPLVKRARVRMGGPSSAEVEQTSSSRTDEKPSCEVAVSCPYQASPLSNCQVDFSDKDAVQMEGLVIVPSNCDAQSLGRLKHWKGMKSQLVSSVDGEAALPPTKRLHRALEAMSANAAEDQLESEVLPSIKTVFNAHCESLPNSQIAVEKDVDGLEKPSMPPMELVKCSQSHASPENAINGVSEKIMTELVNPAGTSNDECESESYVNKCDQNIRTSAEFQNLDKLPPDVDRDEATLGSAFGSFDQQLPPKDGCDTVNTKKCNYGDNGFTEELETEENAKICSIPTREADTLQSSLLEYAVELAASEKSEPLKSHNDDVSSLDHMDEDVKDEHKDRHRSGSGLTSDCNSDDRNVSGPRLSPNSADRVDFFARASSSNTSMCHPSTSESAELMQSNDCCSPNVMSSINKSLDGVVADGELKMNPPSSERSNSIRKSSGQTEAQATLLSFENALGTLTRTKECIGRATRLAIDCAKFGVSAKVVDIIARCLESESSLHRRVDLFFLVDSITQCSRGLKGDVGGLYLSAIQALLPRLLSAAAPPGSVAQENRRQCLKVMRVWLERRILPESVLRQHIRDLDSHGASSSAGPFSRRSARTERTERSLDDPIRDMEGMLVDEYGSNSSFQLPGFCMPCIRKDEDEGSDSDGESFEAVTPEHCSEVLDKHDMTSAIGKRRHILEDVDGELEMEDVAPCEQINSAYNAGTETSKTSGVQSEHPLPLPFAPPLPQDVPPSSPPLPSSPPPFRPPLPQVLPPPPPPPPVTSSHLANCVNSKAYVSMHDRRDDLQQPSVAPRANSTMCGNTMPYHGSESRDMPVAVHASDCNRPSHPYPVHPVNDMQQNSGPSFHRSAYPPRPPHNAPQNHFSYGPSVQHMKSRRDCPPPYSSRFHHAPRMQNGNYYNNHERMRPDPYEFRDNWRGPPPSFSGPRYHDKGRGSYGHSSYDGHPCDRYPDHGWDYPRGSHRNYFHDRPHDSAVPVGMRGPGYWRPR